MPSSPPYKELEGTPQWFVIDRALLELAQNRDLVETTAHEYIVGYLCKALTEPSVPVPNHKAESDVIDSRKKALAKVRSAVRQANPTNRNLAEELIAERRLEAQHD